MNRQMKLLVSALMVAVGLSLPLAAQAWIHDTDANKIDDRIEAVNANGFAHAFENNNINQRMVIGVFDGAPITYAIYVGYDHRPTSLDETTLQGLSVGTTKVYQYIDYIRTTSTFAQIQTIAGLPGVTRVEAIPMMYPTNHWGARVVRSRDDRGLSASQNGTLFPNTQDHLGFDGTGITVGILDSGVNDAQDSINPSYTGHESFLGKWLGGGEFFSGQPLLNTGLNDSINPEDHGDSHHGTHVAGSAIGTGGQDGFFAGVAPAARLVDCKVLSDAGAGFGSADGVEWCIHNMNNDWGLTGADTIYAGIDVINLSLGGLSNSDGSDAGAQMINAAVSAGLVACIATGNDDSINYIGSPAAADSSIACGALNHFQTFDRTDDTVTDFSNEGPRLDDGDADNYDEMKPSVSAPGAGTVSADGNTVTTTGGAYSTKSGTSMSTPHITGVVALMLQANPNLAPGEVRQILQNTAIHNIPSDKGNRPADPFNIDSNYSPMAGWGEVDAYAACKEALNATSGSQVVRIRPIARPNDVEIDVNWWVQREFTINGYNVMRAEDVNGSPGTFTQVNGAIIAPVGDAVLVDDDNRDLYTFVDDDPALQLGTKYWYRIDWVDGSGTTSEPPASVVLGESARIATVFYSMFHNTPDNDLFIRVGVSSNRDPSNAEYFFIGGGEAQADSVIQTEPNNAAASTIGSRELFWSQGFTADDNINAPLLPPTQGFPWFFNVAEGGFINRAGRLTSFSMFVNDSPGSAGGTLYVSDTTAPVPTVETQESNMWIPEASTLSAEVAAFHGTSRNNGNEIVVEVYGDNTYLNDLRLHRGLTDRFEDRELVTGFSQETDGLRTVITDHQVEHGIRYHYWIELVQADGSRVFGGPVAITATAGLNNMTRMQAASPNPVQSQTTFRYALRADVAKTGSVPVQITIHDIQGRLVRTLKDANEPMGDYQVTWDTTGNTGQQVASGVYYYRFRAGSVNQTARLIVTR
ncbi:MAG: S8 family serine peptidase [Candidatus Eisenbacteria bacterium]|uniref:S8 family serine peptidase n=1 Tax=Eiseniibacteriota bacterium TaxID=2212470 RepID=A0A7Y2EB98_UNCEI|nr:S8 family serine peptidase [Candidatus Eisenbacteria bacterium]